MKINKLFAILFAVLGVNTLSAQTDVTSTYLTNPDFEGTYSRFLDVNTDRGVEKPLGWSVEWYQDNNDKNGMTFVAESMTQDSKTWSGKSGKSYFARMRWGNATLYLRQTLQNLRPGNYTLSFSATGHTTNAANSIQVSVAGQTQVITLGSNENGNWTDYSINFNITETTPYATVEFKAVRGGDLLKVGVDEFKLMYDGSSYYETIINKAQALYDENKDWAENGLTDFEAAISANKGKSNIADINEAIVALETAMAAFRTQNSVDVTVKINNPNFDSNIDGWTKTGGDGNAFQRQTSTQPNFTGGFLEKWRNGWNGGYNQKDFEVYQEIANLPNGEYTVKAYIQAQMQGSKETLGDSYKDKKHGGPYYISDEKGVWMYATSGDNSSNVWANSHNPDFGEKGGGVLRTATVNVTNGQLKIGFKGIGSPNGGVELGTYANWIACDTWTLSYFGFDPSTLLTLLESLKEEANSLLESEDYNTVTGAERTTLKNAIEITPKETKAELETAISTLETATAAFKAATSDYATLAIEKEIAAGLGMSDEAIATATATTKTGLVALQDLKVAEYNYIQQTYTETAMLGSWAEDFGGELDNEGYKASSPKYMDEWSESNVTRTAKQTITLPAGNYALSVIARGQAGASGQLYYKIGETTTNVALIMKGNRGRGVDVDGVANFSDEATYNCNGEGFGWEYRFVTFNLAEETEVEIGVSATFANAWVSIYAPVLLTTEASIKNLRLTEITNLLSEVPTGKMNATVQSTLDSKKAAAEAASLETEIEELTIITTELSEAIAAAKASIADYELIAGYIAKANKIDESIAADYQTAYDNGTISETTETVFQNLEVATYNYVIGEFTYNVELEAGGWVPEGPVGSKDVQHYSGNTSSYMEQSDAAWGSNAWTISYKYEKTLPAGKYIFKVAGRRAQGTGNTMSLNVTNITDSENPVELGSVNDFPEGDVGLGINKNGVTSFNAEDEAGFANNNAGRGWQWRYVMFELGAETTVEVAVNAAATTNYQWISFCDATLQMTEETYLNANKGALDAPTAAAEALVDTKPMGDAENTALKDALAMPVTTGAELQAKIDALNVAVTNANAWVAAYNEAQAPLVAALERFETDYNNGEEGAIDYMAQSRWATVIEMVEAAALAKDVTNSYEGFAAATTNLVAALDAADVSIADYKALKEALDNANAAATVNWGDEPFQRPEEDKEELTNAINAAQAVYTAATADGDGVTSQTTALNDALDVVNNLELNAPAEGAVYNIIVATAGHALEGAPVVATLEATGDNNPTGYGFAAKEAYTDGPANMLYTFTKVEGNNYHISVKVKGKTVYLTYGSLNGSAAGWKESQIQGTTNIETAGEFEIVASNTTEGVIKIRNTVTNDFIDSQDGGNIYTDTGIENEDFKLTLVEELSAEISIDAADKFATCVLMFDADLANTEGLKVYVPESYTTQDGLNYFIFKAFEEAVLPAYTPCILYAANGFEGTLTGTVNMEGYAYNVAKGGYLYGALESQNITEGYVMVKLDDEDEVTFRNVSSSGIAEGIKIPAGKCWLEVPAVQATVSSFTCLFRGGEASNIDEVLLDKISVKDGAIYTLDGKRVNDIERGKIYIINGKKAIVK